MNNTIYFETFSVVKDQTLYNENLIYKGDLGVILDLTKISESSSKALKLTIDWGDGSSRETYERQLLYQYTDSSILDEVGGGKVGGSVLNMFDHVYEPAETHVSKLSLSGENDGNWIIRKTVSGSPLAPLTLYITHGTYRDKIGRAPTLQP